MSAIKGKKNEAEPNNNKSVVLETNLDEGEDNAGGGGWNLFTILFAETSVY